MFNRIFGIVRAYRDVCNGHPAQHTCQECRYQLCDYHDCAARCSLCRRVFCHDHVNNHRGYGMNYI